MKTRAIQAGPELVVTYRRGRILAAYWHLPRRPGQKSYRTDKIGGLLVDYSRSGKPIGIEIPAPAELSLVALNRVLRQIGQPTVRRVDIAPLLAV